MNHKIQTFWLRDEKNNPVACIASDLTCNEDDNNCVCFNDFGLSIRNPKDSFNKALGRKIATDRMALGDVFCKLSGTLELLDSPGFRETRRRTVQYILNMPAVPQRIKDIAQAWLDRPAPAEKRMSAGQ